MKLGPIVYEKKGKIKIQHLPPYRDNSLKGVRYLISEIKNGSNSKSETTFAVKKPALIYEFVSKIFFS